MQEHLNKEIKEFDNWLILQSASQGTRETYIARVKDFLLKVNGPITEEVINNYFLNIKDKWSNKTFNGYKDALSAYVKFRKLAIALPKSQKVMKKIPDAIDNEFFENELIEKVNDIFQKPEKVKAILYLLQYCGLRPSEVVALERRDFDFKNLEVHLKRKKTNEESITVYTPKIRALIKAYFCSEPEVKNAFNVTRSAIGKMCDKLKEHIKEVRVRPYLFRHSYGTTLKKKGFDVMDIADAMGHSSLKSTECYVRRDKSEFKKKYLARMK